MGCIEGLFGDRLSTRALVLLLLPFNLLPFNLPLFNLLPLFGIGAKPFQPPFVIAREHLGVVSPEP